MSAKNIALIHPPTGREVIVPIERANDFTAYGWAEARKTETTKPKETADAKARPRRSKAVSKAASNDD